MKNISSFFTIFILGTFLSQNIIAGEPKDKEAISIFKGKNLVTFGNSITAAKNSWAYKVAERLEFGNIYNGALGGAVWSKRLRKPDGQTIITQNYSDPNFAGISNGYSPDPDIEEFQKRINNCAIVHIQKYLSNKDILNPDIIILSYGTNDISDESVIGDANTVLQQKDLSKVDLLTIAGAVRWCIETLRTNFPDAKLYIALPIQAKSETKNEGNLKKIAAIKKVCDGMAVTYFDCYAECGITKENESEYLRDGLHPNEDGSVVHAGYIINKLKEVYK